MTNAPTRTEHEITRTVRGCHLDRYGRVNNARYLELGCWSGLRKGRLIGL